MRTLFRSFIAAIAVLLSLTAWLAALRIASLPAFAQAANVLFELLTGIATNSIPITISTATTTQLIPPPAGTGPSGAPLSIRVTSVDIIAAGAGNIQFIAGTGATCGTGTVNVTGNYNLQAGQGLAKGGFGPVWVLPPGLGLCAVTSAAVAMPGSLAYRLY